MPILFKLKKKPTPKRMHQRTLTYLNLHTKDIPSCSKFYNMSLFTQKNTRAISVDRI